VATIEIGSIHTSTPGGALSDPDWSGAVAPSMVPMDRPNKPVSVPRKPDTSFKDQLRGFSLTTAEILYRLPDHPSVLQTFVWQDYDLSPRFPKLLGFLEYWKRNLDGPVCQVRVAHAALIKPAELRCIDGEFRLN
jgi:uncharacterized protein Usg